VSIGGRPDVEEGLVSDGNGFEDTPDCERIAGGVNSKGPHALALGRQANLLQWGFYTAPDRMTVPARRAFLNAIVWMKQFRGARPLASKQARSRAWMDAYLALAAVTKPGDPLAGYVKRQFPAELVADGMDAAKLRRWVQEHRGYLHGGAGYDPFVVDADLLALGTANDDPKLLDWLLETLGKDAHDERALRIAQRYLGEHGTDATSVRAFVTANRGRLFFSDTAGFRWLVAPPAHNAAK
jgi:hypothetical protein